MPGPQPLPPEDKKAPMSAYRLSHDAHRKIEKMIDANVAENNTDAVETALEDYEIKQ